MLGVEIEPFEGDATVHSRKQRAIVFAFFASDGAYNSRPLDHCEPTDELLFPNELIARSINVEKDELSKFHNWLEVYDGSGANVDLRAHHLPWTEPTSDELCGGYYV